MNINSKEINAIAELFKSGKTVAQIAEHKNMSRQNIKRALAEAGLMTLSWYKTSNEIAMLNYLRGMGINNLIELRKVL